MNFLVTLARWGGGGGVRRVQISSGEYLYSFRANLDVFRPCFVKEIGLKLKCVLLLSNNACFFAEPFVVFAELIVLQTEDSVVRCLYLKTTS